MFHIDAFLRSDSKKNEQLQGNKPSAFLTFKNLGPSLQQDFIVIDSSRLHGFGDLGVGLESPKILLGGWIRL